ncbi:hypothetical protein HAP41_0000020535 [Bradyrhizobium barranii subsp. apii]|uniref:Uncharacterized protein n=1 Tax=Bradyrhizobium barranii subsp. apii TaxID=2819348 RepID=A0A8T5VAR6_9BRAD|nr:hypothetical protein [Bradyrhizobium barranii]UPT91101.1 hypothetical protein HAP41_0000020535 [Bradyrhizobium barranii subsp. apii]
MPEALEVEISAFFNKYMETFTTWDGDQIAKLYCAPCITMRIPTKPAMHSNSKPAGYSDLKPATRGVVRMGQFHDVVEGWEGQETG